VSIQTHREGVLLLHLVFGLCKLANVVFGRDIFEQLHHVGPVFGRVSNACTVFDFLLDELDVLEVELVVACELFFVILETQTVVAEVQDEHKFVAGRGLADLDFLDWNVFQLAVLVQKELNYVVVFGGAFGPLEQLQNQLAHSAVFHGILVCEQHDCLC